MVFSMAAEIKRGLISAWTKEALRARRASGLPVGRPKGPGKSKLDKHRPEIEALLANGSTQKFIAKRYNSSPANLANCLSCEILRRIRYLCIVSVSQRMQKLLTTYDIV